MPTLILVSRLCVMFAAISGFLLGQVFFGKFDGPATLAGVSGLLAATLSGQFVGASGWRALLVIVLCLAGLAGVGLDAYGYYGHHNAPGNYYAWFMVGPFCLFLALLAVVAARRRPNGRSIRRYLGGTGNPDTYGALMSIPGFAGLPVIGKWMVMLLFVSLFGLIVQLFN